MSGAPHGLVTLEFWRSESGEEPAGSVAILTLQNPPLNLITINLLVELRALLSSLAGSLIRAVVICQGDARLFSAGSDMREFQEVLQAGADSKILLENEVLDELAGLPVPVVAAIEGGALGGGLELALACDLRVATQGAVLGLPEVAVGGLASNGTQRLTKIVGPARAKHLLLLGEPISADVAHQWGLVTEIVEDGRALSRALEMTETIASRAPMSIELSKKLVDAAVDQPLDRGLRGSIEAQRQIFSSQDLIEGATAFAERRRPRFQGC